MAVRPVNDDSGPPNQQDCGAGVRLGLHIGPAYGWVARRWPAWDQVANRGLAEAGGCRAVAACRSRFVLAAEWSDVIASRVQVLAAGQAPWTAHHLAVVAADPESGRSLPAVDAQLDAARQQAQGAAHGDLFLHVGVD